jgi:hypothetical protein
MGNQAGASPGGGAGTGGASAGGASGTGGSSASSIQHVFVVTLENHDEVQIIGSMADAPYINGTLVKNYASASQFADILDLGVPSEPHYVLMEAGTNAFSDRTFTGDGDPTASNSTASTEHLVTQMKNAQSPISFMSYQEGLDSSTGACPIHSSGYYAAKHDPFVFFQDVAGSPPSASNAYCVAHHKPMTSLAADLKNDAVAAYNFITPNLCNDMHGASGCPSSNTIRAGDDWLGANLPAMIDYANGHHGVIFLVWDEGSATLTMPFLAVGPGVKKGYVGNVRYTHRSLVKSVERIFGLPALAKVAGDQDFADLFESGRFP